MFSRQIDYQKSLIVFISFWSFVMVINAERPAIKYKRDVDEFVQPPSDKIPIGSVVS